MEAETTLRKLGRIASFLFLLVISLFVGCPLAQLHAAAPFDRSSNAEEWLIKTWEKEDVLPDNSVTSIVQTSDGYLWFGTFGGLVRFDGVKFTVFNPKNTLELPSDGIVNLHVDRTGRLWVSTLKGLVALENGKWRQMRLHSAESGDYARTISERSNGDILITTFKGKVIEYSKEHFTELPPPPGAASGQGYLGSVDEEGRWWLVHTSFIGRWDSERWVPTISAPGPLIDQVAFGPARDGGMWILLGEELRKLLHGKETARITLRERLGACYSLFEDSRAHIWIATDHHGFVQIAPDGSTSRWRERNGNVYNGRKVFEDRENNLWLGTTGVGPMQLKPRRVHTFDQDSVFKTALVTSVCPDREGGIWAGTYGAGLFRGNAAGFGPIALPGGTGLGQSSYILKVLTDRNSRVWTSTFGENLLMWEGQKVRVFSATEAAGEKIRALFEDSRGRLWVSGNTTAVYDGANFQKLDPKEADTVGSALCFAEDAQGAMWAANGSKVFRRSESGFLEVRGTTNQPLEGIICLRSDSDGSMWMGSSDGSLFRWRQGKIDALETSYGLPLRSVRSITADSHGFFWMTSDRSIVRVNRNDLHAATDGLAERLNFQMFDGSDGLIVREFSGYGQPVTALDSTGRLWFATSRGVVMINPAELRLNETPPPVHIEGISFHRRSPKTGNQRGISKVASEVETQLRGPFSGPVSLPAGSRRIEVLFTGLSFVDPEKMRFKVKLDSRDEDWQDMGNRRTAYYHDLPPGQYTFRVRAANNDGVWNEQGARLAFSVLPFFWQTGWFRSLAWFGVVGEGLLIVALLGKHRRLRRTQSELQESEERITLAAEAAQLGMWVWDIPREHAWMTEKLRELFGLRPEDELSYASFLALVHPDDRPTVDQSVKEALAKRSRYEIQFQIVRADGSNRTIASIGRVDCDASGEPRHLLGVAIDITERLQMQKELSRHRTEMAHISRLSVMGELSASMAHELNQPLTAILANAQAAQRFIASGETDLEEFKDISKDIVQDTTRARDVIRHLRTLVKKGEVEYTRLDINEVIEQVVGFLHGDIVGRNVTVHLELPLNLPTVRGDRIQVQQVLLNLLLNAFDAMAGNAQPDRRVTVISSVKSPAMVQVAVCDQGTGLAPGQIEKLFRSFYTTKPKGLGIGLSVSRSIIEAHGGQLWAENNQGRGAVFSFTLPIISEVTDQSAGALDVSKQIVST